MQRCQHLIAFGSADTFARSSKVFVNKAFRVRTGEATNSLHLNQLLATACACACEAGGHCRPRSWHWSIARLLDRCCWL
jgi:hypothetical protein